MEQLITKLLEGSVDAHLHMGPDPYRERPADALEVALHAKEMGMRGVVLKSHDYPTAPLAELTRKVVPGVEVIGSLTLNQGVGGINPQAVEVSAKLGARVLWMPTFSALCERKNNGFSDGIFLLEENGKVLPEVKEILRLAKHFDLMLCTGHISQEEILGLFAEALRMGIGKFVVTHPLKASLDLNIQRDLVKRGAYIEHCFVSTTSLVKKIAPSEIVEAIRYVGVKGCLLSTDFGQLRNPPPWEGMRMMIATFLEGGLSEEEMSVLIKDNPCRLLNL